MQVDTDIMSSSRRIAEFLVCATLHPPLLFTLQIPVILNAAYVAYSDINNV